MATSDRSRIEVLRRRVYPTTGTDVISIGDMLVKDASGNARPASTAADADAVADAFIGLAIHAKVATETPDITVGVDLVAEMDIAPTGAIKVGEKVEIAEDSGTPMNQQVVLGSTNPIGKVAYKEASGASTVRVHMVGIDVAGPPVAD